MAYREGRDRALLHEQKHRQAHPGDRGPRHFRPRGRGPAEGHEAAAGAAARRDPVAVDHL